MATTQEHTVSVKLLVHKNQNKVIFAEADNHFADILFSFLTLPLGTIIRLLGGEQSDTEPAGLEVGSLTNLYKSVSDLDTKFFSTEMCKNMLLYPRNNAEAECQRLKVNIDDTEPIKYFICPVAIRDYYALHNIRTWKTARCECGWLTTISIPFKDDVNNNNQEAIFFEEHTMLIIGDDFSIMPSSPKVIMELLNRFGITDVKGLTERVVDIGIKEIVNLLKYSLISKTPITDAFLRAGHQTQKVICEPSAVISSNDDDNTQKFTLELLVRKSDDKVLFAEANEDFINQIFSFLTIPLGLVVRLLGGNSSCGSIDQLYASVVDQKLGKYLISPENSKLLHPKLPLHYSCDTQLLPLPVADDNRVQVNKESTSSSAYLSHYNQYTRNYSYILNPKHQNGSGYSEGGCFVKSASFVVTDDLVVKPASSILSLSFMEHLNVLTSDVEEKVIQFGIHQVYKLLNYSLVSESPLTESLMDLLIKTPKRKRSEI